MKVIVLSPYPPGLSPGQRFRFEQWIGLLPPGAVDVDIRPAFSAQAYRMIYQRGHLGLKVGSSLMALGRRFADTAIASRADVVLLYREAYKFGPPLIEKVLEQHVPVVYDFDDAIFVPTVSSANPTVGRLRQHSKIRTIIRGAAQTTAGNEYLAQFARRYSSKVHVIPTTLDVNQFTPRLRRPSTSGRIRVGWSGSFSTVEHLETISGVLRTTLGSNRNVELIVVGASKFNISGPSVETKAWDLRTEIDDISSFDIGVMPLPNDDFAQGKCGFKALLYMSLGVPCIASPVGVNTEIICHGQNGLLASTPEEWHEALNMLIDDPALRRSLGAAGRETVVERYSGQRWAPRFLELLERAAG